MSGCEYISNNPTSIPKKIPPKKPSIVFPSPNNLNPSINFLPKSIGCLPS